jgi:hypothetical protein
LKFLGGHENQVIVKLGKGKSCGRRDERPKELRTGQSSYASVEARNPRQINFADIVWAIFIFIKIVYARALIPGDPRGSEAGFGMQEQRQAGIIACCLNY